jgi:hypothetical protein
MRWRAVDRLHLILMRGDPARPIPIPTKQNVRVPVWVCDLWQASKDRLPDWPNDTREFFQYKLEKSLLVVGKPGGVDPDEFSAALRLGGWEAAMQLHPELRTTVPAVGAKGVGHALASN